MDKITANIEKEFGIELGPVIDRYFDRDMPDQSIYFFEKYALIITDYFSDNDIKTFYPKKISEYGKEFKRYIKTNSGDIGILSSGGWIILAEMD